MLKICQRYANDNYLNQLVSWKRYNIEEFVRDMRDMFNIPRNMSKAEKEKKTNFLS